MGGNIRWITLVSCSLIVCFLSSTTNSVRASTASEEGDQYGPLLESLSAHDKVKQTEDAVRAALSKRANMGYRMMCQLHPRNCPGRQERRGPTKRTKQLYPVSRQIKPDRTWKSNDPSLQDFPSVSRLEMLRDELEKNEAAGGEWIPAAQLRDQARRQLLVRR